MTQMASARGNRGPASDIVFVKETQNWPMSPIAAQSAVIRSSKRCEMLAGDLGGLD